MKVNSQLERAQFENLTVLPTSATAGRVAFNTTDGKMYLDDAASWRAILRNDGNIIVGNDPLPANNVRFHRGGPGFIQVLLGNDVTAEGTLSTTLAQMSLRHGNFTSGTLPANGNAGRLVWVSDTGFLNIDTGSSWNSIVDASSAQTIAGKTLVDPTISASTVFSQIVTPATPSSGTRKIYAKADGLYQLDSSGIETKVGSGSGSAGSTPLNALFPNPDAETNAPGFSTYADVVSAVPTTGLGGTPTLTFVRSTTTPLDGLYSWLLTKPASNIQGQGVNAAITVPTSYQGRVLQGSFSCKVLTGTYTDGDAQLFFFDATNNVVVSLMEGQSILNAIGSQEQLFRFQMPINCTSGRFLIHWTTTSATALTMQFDDFSLGKQLISRTNLRGPVGSIIYTGSLTVPAGYLYADGSAVSRTQYGKLFSLVGSAYGVGDGTSTFNLPDLRGIFIRGAGTNATGATAGYAGTLGAAQADQFQAHGHAMSAYGSNINGQYNDTTTAVNSGANRFGLLTGQTATTPLDLGTGAGAPRYGNETRPANVAMAAYICYDDGNVAISSDVSGQYAYTDVLVSAVALTPGGGNPLKYDLIIKDTLGAYSSATGKYTAKSSGEYAIFITNQTNSSTDLYIYKNNAYYSRLGDVTAANAFTSSAGSVHLDAGDTFFIATSGGTTFAANQCRLTVYKINSGSQQIAALEAVNCAYSSAAAQSIPNATWTTIGFATKEDDTNGAYDGTTWTSKANGRYLVSLTVTALATAAGGEALVRAFYNNTEYTGERGTIPNTGPMSRVFSKVFSNVKIGDTITLGFYQSNGGAISLEGRINSTYFSITRLN